MEMTLEMHLEAQREEIAQEIDAFRDKLLAALDDVPDDQEDTAVAIVGAYTVASAIIRKQWGQE